MIERERDRERQTERNWIDLRQTERNWIDLRQTERNWIDLQMEIKYMERLTMQRQSKRK